MLAFVVPIIAQCLCKPLWCCLIPSLYRVTLPNMIKPGNGDPYLKMYVCGILFREIMKKLAPRNIRGFNFREYVHCSVPHSPTSC